MSDQKNELTSAVTPAGVPQQWSVTPPEGLHEPYAQFYRDAVLAGYVEYPIGGPWGRQVATRDEATGQRLKNDPLTGQCYHSGERYADDLSVCLRKGDVRINIVDRQIPRRDGSIIVDHQLQGWFKNGQQAFALPIDERFDDEAIEATRRACNECKQIVAHEEDLKHAGFAGRYCPTCYPVVQPRVEFDGWCN